MSRYLRGVLALVVGAIIFSTASILVTAISVATLGLARPLIVHAPMMVGKFMVVVVYRGILGMRIMVRRKNRYWWMHPTLMMANHPTDLLTMLFLAYAEPLVGMPMVLVGKDEHRRNPFIGWPLVVSGLGIFIDRTKRHGALETIRRSIGRVTRRGQALCIFPDRSRPTPEFIADDQRKFAGRVPRLQEFRHTGIPRDGGIFAAYDAMQSPRVIDITAECSVPTARWSDVFGMVGATYFVRSEDVTRFVPHDPASRREWLQKRWRLKNKAIAYARGVTQR